MAYTKTPEQDTHSHFRIPPRGNQSFVSHTRPYEYEMGSKYVNCYPMVRESKTTDPRVTLIKAPRVLQKVWQFPDNNAGITDYDYETHLFVHNQRIYKVIPTGPTGPEIRLLYECPYILKSCQKAIDYTLSGDTLLVGLCKGSLGTYSYVYNETQNTFTASTDPISEETGLYVESGYVEDGYVASDGEFAVVRDLLVDGYHIVALKAIKEGTNRVLISNPGDYNLFYTDTDYFTPEIDPDNIVDIQKHHNFICVIGTHTIEFFYNAANELGSAFSRQENYTITLGAQQNMLANNGLVSIAFGDDIYLLANSENGGNAIYVIRNFKPIRISDDYIDYLLNDETGIIEDIPTNTIRLGVIDIMGNVQFAFELSSYDTGYKRTFVFNERDMVWWEWKESTGGNFVAANYGPTSNLNGHPFILDAAHLGVVGNAQYTIGTILTEETITFLVLDEYCPYGNAEEGETQELLLKFNKEPGTTLGLWEYTEPAGPWVLTDTEEFNETTNPDWGVYYFQPSEEFPIQQPYQNLGWLEAASFEAKDVVTEEAPYGTVAGNKFTVRAILPLQENIYAETNYTDIVGLDPTYYFILLGQNDIEVQGAIKKFYLYLNRPNNAFSAKSSGDLVFIDANNPEFDPYLTVYFYDSAQGDGELEYNFNLSGVELPVNEFGFVDATISLFLATDGNSARIHLTYDIGAGEVDILEVDFETPISTPGDNSENSWTVFQLRPAELDEEAAEVRENNPNKICVFSVVNTAYTPALEPDLPTVNLSVRSYDQYTGIDYNVLDIPTGEQSIILFDWVGTNYDSYSLDVISGPDTGTLVADNALSGGAMQWTGQHQEQPIAPNMFAGTGTYVVRITVTNSAGSDTDDVTVTINPFKTINVIDAVIKGYAAKLDSLPYMTDTSPELVQFCGAENFVQFVFNNTGEFILMTDGNTFPDPGDYQWLSEDTELGFVQPVDPAECAKYEISLDFVDDLGSGLYYPFPWNWWASYGYTRDQMGTALDGMKGAGSSAWGTWLSLDATRSWEVNGYGRYSGETIRKPVLIAVAIRRADSQQVVASTVFTLYLNPPG